MIPVITTYVDKGATFQRPETDIDPKKKDNAYALTWARYLYSLFCNNQTAWAASDISRFERNRQYSLGKQSTDQYKSWLINESNADTTSTVSVTSFDDTAYSRVGKRQGWTNVNFDDPQSPAPAILNALHGALDKQDWDCYVNTIDETSKDLIEQEKYRRMVEAAFSDWQIEFKKKAGIPVDEEMIYPRSQEEFDMFEMEEGFKLAVAGTMQELTRHSFEISRWDNVVRTKVIDDLICLGYAAVKDYFDSRAKKWKTKYLDPSYLIMQYSNEFDYHDADFAGYVSFWTISSLREKLPDVDEKSLLSLAEGVTGKYGNPINWDSQRYSEIDPTSKVYKNIGGWKVPVLECAWMDFDIEKRLYYRNKAGRNLVINLGYNGKVNPLSEETKAMGATQQVKQIGMRVPRECYWVIDTDIIFDYGTIKMADRENIAEPRLPYHVEQLLQPPIMEVLIPILDEIEQLYLRYQNSMAMMIENGIQINTALLQNVNYGGAIMPIHEVVKMGLQTGRWLYSYMSQGGLPGMYGGGTAVPITPIQGGLATRVQETTEALTLAFKKIELFLGFNLATIGVTPEPNVPVGSTKEAMQSTINTLKPILDRALEIKQSAGESMMRRIQIGIRNDEGIRTAYSDVVGKAAIEALRQMEGNAVQYGMTLKPKPDDKMKALFYKWMDEAVANTKAGNVELHTSDKIYFSTRLEAGGDIVELTKQLRYRIKKNQEEYQKQSEASIAQQTQGNLEAQAQKHQQEMEKISTEGQIRLQEEMVRGQIKDQESTKQMLANIYQGLQEEDMAERGLNAPKGGK